jgi:hypothetical protein
MASWGGHRPGSGRKPRDTIIVQCSIPRSVYNELIRRETETGVYRTRVAAQILCEWLSNGPPVMDQPQTHAPNGNSEAARLKRMPRAFADFHW